MLEESLAGAFSMKMTGCIKVRNIVLAAALSGGLNFPRSQSQAASRFSGPASK